jgi:hypothetical protein
MLDQCWFSNIGTTLGCQHTLDFSTLDQRYANVNSQLYIGLPTLDQRYPNVNSQLCIGLPTLDQRYSMIQCQFPTWYKILF